MKRIDIHRTATAGELLQLVQQKLNPLFKEQRQTELIFTIEKIDGGVEISQPEWYEGFLFRIEPAGNELKITRSEHYVDDVNAITVESILHQIFEDLAADGNVTLAAEG